jgi:hypothetical protein
MSGKSKKWLAAVLLLIGAVLITWNVRVGSGIERGLPNSTRRDLASKVAELPPLVQATVRRECEGGTVEDVDNEGDADNRTYEVEIVKGHTKITLEIAPDGTVRKRKSKPLKP